LWLTNEKENENENEKEKEKKKVNIIKYNIMCHTNKQT